MKNGKGLPGWATSLRGWAKVLAAVAGAVGLVSGYLVDVVTMPGRVAKMEVQQARIEARQDSAAEQRGRIIQWVALNYCEERGLTPTECNPEKIPRPGTALLSALGPYPGGE